MPHPPFLLLCKSAGSPKAALPGILFRLKVFWRTPRCSHQQTQQVAISKMTQLFENFETRITNFLVQAESASTRSIELELQSARQLIETYKNEQLALIDENIVAMMEQTLSSVLGKKLSLKDQLDLVYESLEKAKVDKFII